MEPVGSRAQSRAGHLRREISLRNLERAQGLSHELTVGLAPSVLYHHEEEGGSHGNFLSASYRRICASADWSKRLLKVYTASRHVPRQMDRQRRELDCANSSDALLMNIFCYPGVPARPQACSMLGIQIGTRPEFGFRPMLQMKGGARDRTEIDMRLGSLLVEAKLTEGDFQTARPELVNRFSAFEEIFDIERLPVSNGIYRSYQLIRGVMAAASHGCSFCVMCDARRCDLIDEWFQVMLSVRSADLRCRLSVLTWQEFARSLPRKVQGFLGEKYGIEST